MTTKDDLTTTRTNMISALAVQSANPKPTYNIDGQMVDWNTYYNTQTKIIANLKMMIDAENDDDITEIQSQLFT